MNMYQIYNNLCDLVYDVKQKLKLKGFVIPIKKSETEIVLGEYKIIKNKDNLYDVIDKFNNTKIENINLPQTAILVANTLALGKSVNIDLLTMDREYGYNLFEDHYYKQIKENTIKQRDWDRAEILETKRLEARSKATNAKKSVLRQYSKLEYFDK